MNQFRKFCQIDLQLRKRTVKGHLRNLKQFLGFIDKPIGELTRDDLRQWLETWKDNRAGTYANKIKTLRRFFRDFLRSDLAEGFKLPKRELRPKVIPTRAKLRKFYESITAARDKAAFLMLASSGLRRDELLDLKAEDVDFDKRMVIPSQRQSMTKQTWVSFYNEEAGQVLERYLHENSRNDGAIFGIKGNRLSKIFQDCSKRCGIRVSPKVLREWFAEEMANLGVQDRFVDAFCGRVPATVLAKNYTDYAPRKLREIYEKAGLKVLE
jgi:integrase